MVHDRSPATRLIVAPHSILASPRYDENCRQRQAKPTRGEAMYNLFTCFCGQEVEVNEDFGTRCTKCGRHLSAFKPQAGEVLPHRSGWSKKALGSLLLGVPLAFGWLTGIRAILLGWRALRDIDRRGGWLKGGGAATTGILLGVISCIYWLLAPPVSHCGEAMRRVACSSNLRQIGLAIRLYETQHGCLPPAAICDKKGKRLLSWRVALLPYLEERELYKEFHLDEPWNNPHNIQLLAKRPGPFGCPSGEFDPSRCTTEYVTIDGPDRGAGFRQQKRIEMDRLSPRSGHNAPCGRVGAPRSLDGSRRSPLRSRNAANASGKSTRLVERWIQRFICEWFGSVSERSGGISQFNEVARSQRRKRAARHLVTRTAACVGGG